MHPQDSHNDPWYRNIKLAQDFYNKVEQNKPLIRRAYDHFEGKGWTYQEHIFIPGLDGVTLRGVTACCQPTDTGVRLDVLVPNIAVPFDDFRVIEVMDLRFAIYDLSVPTDDVGYAVNDAIMHAKTAWKQLDYLRRNPPAAAEREEISELERMYKR